MTSFIAIYYGQTVTDAKLIAVSAEKSIIADVSARLLNQNFEERDQIISSLENGRRKALEHIHREARNDRK